MPGGTFRATNPATGEPVGATYHRAAAVDVDRAARLALEAWPALDGAGGRGRAALLRRIAVGLETIRDELRGWVPQETGLPPARVDGELTRTCFQLRLFADVAERGEWVEARIHHGDPARRPQPRPDLRAMRRGVGPVAVFESSNFPLAFGVAGNDTSSALAVGCPVVAKAHPLHPGTSERVAWVVQAAVAELGLPEGSFSLLFDDGLEVGKALVQHPAIRAVGFTGSHQGGRALMDLAAARPHPIPVHAEMGSVNPVFVLPHALRQRSTEIARALAASVTLGAGQFCTCPGLVLAAEGEGLERLREELRRALGETAPAPMLGRRIARAYEEGVARLARRSGVTASPSVLPGAEGAPRLLETQVPSFLSDPVLHEEVFGPSTLLVVARDAPALERAADALHGQLTATLWMEPEDEALARRLAAVLARKAGRVLANGVPTGVEVSPAMAHGGPYPATSDGRSSSIGATAVDRWLRWVCFQDLPQALLPPELQEANPLGVRRWVDGEWMG